MKNQFTKVTYENQNYKVCTDKKGIVFVVDDNIVLPNVYYNVHQIGYVYFHKNNNTLNTLHTCIMNHQFADGIYVDHINRIKTDNRSVNLRLATQSEQNKNQAKKKRNVVLPENCLINVSNIPTFMWYIKASGSHGDRWAVEIKDKYLWKTTSQKSVSTLCKFELAKKHLRHLITDRPELFVGHCMNGELSEIGKKLQTDYSQILKLAGHDYVPHIPQEYLEENIENLNMDEILLLQSDTYLNKHKPKCKLPVNCGITVEMIPKYCYYLQGNDTKGDGFTCDRNHPMHTKDWTTTRSKKVSIQEKFKQLTMYLQNQEYTPVQDVQKIK